MKSVRLSLKQRLTNTQIWKSIFRHGHDDTTKNRVLMIMGNIWLHLHPSTTRRTALRLKYTWGMGGLTFLMFLVTLITGVYLMFYYRPTPEYAYADMQDIEHTVPFGQQTRNMHRWSAHAMVIFVMLHMLRVFLTGAYKKPREFNWVIGVVLLTLTLLLSFTGYLLPWDQLSVWAVTVGTNMARATPGIGHEGPMHPWFVTQDSDIRFLLLGGSEVGAPALLRFYVLHCIFIPLVAGMFMIVHFWRVRKDGGISGPPT